MHRTSWLPLLAVALGASAAVAGVIHVPADVPLIHDAVQAAAAGDTVLVAPGTYTDCTHETEGPGSTPACVIMKAGVTLRGSGPEATVIDAQNLGRGIFVEYVADCRIENLQVRGAFAEAYGAGILVRHVDDDVTLTDLRVTENEDGGIICISHAHPVLTRVALIDNVGKQGGGIAIEDTSFVQMYDCLVDGNQAPSAAGIFVRGASDALIARCTITGNAIDSASGNGGGIGVQEANIQLHDSVISGNTTLGYGGGLMFTNNATGEVRDCEITNNVAAAAFNEGAGVYASQSPVTLRNVVIAGNLASGAFAEGGGVAVSFDPAPLFEQCTIVGNVSTTAETTAGVYASWFSTARFVNCIIANSEVGRGITCAFDAAPEFTGCDVWGNAAGNEICGVDGGCNFSADPLFCTEPGMAYRIQLTSPCAAGHHPTPGCGETYCGAYPAGCTDVAVEDVPAGRGLVLGNAPNPFNPNTTIHFVLDAPGAAVVRILDLRGRAVREFRFPDVPAGQRREFAWNGADDAGLAMPSGVYLVRLEAGGATTSKRMSLIR